MNHLSEGDVRSFKNFVRLELGMFNQMVADLTPRLKKTTTNCRKPLSVGLNLAITLRYLATGDSYKSLTYGFRVAPNTIVSIMPEVCQAIYDHYHETAFKCPTTEAEWKEVASGFSDKWNFLHCYGAISLVHMRLCTRGANLHPGCIFGHVNGVLRICTRVQPGCKFAPAFEVVQIYLHPGPNCAHERKLYNFYTF